MIVVRNILLSVCCLNLFSCAIETKEVAQQEQSAIKSEKIEIDDQLVQQFDQAKNLLVDKQYQPAIELLNNVIKEETRFAAPFVNLAMAYGYLDDEKQAEKFLRRALEIDLGHIAANNELGILYRKQGRFAEARKAYENALAEHPDDLLILRNFGILCDLYLADLSCAQQLYKKYLDISDDKNIKIWLLDLERRM